MISTLCYVVMYYNIDKLLQTLYIPYIAPNNVDIISSHVELYFLLKITSYFMLALYSYTLSYRLFISQVGDKNSIVISFIYTKYLVDILISPNSTLVEYEISRGVMWVFTIPLLLTTYCHANDLTTQDINIHYAIISIVPRVLVIPFKGESVYLCSTILSSIPALLFLQSLYTPLNI